MKKYLFSLILLGGIITHLQAGCVSTGCSNVKVTSLYVNNTGIIYVGTSGDEKRLGCRAVSGVYLTIRASDKGKDAIYATLLTAQTTNTPVKIRANSSTGCNIAYVVLAH